MITTAGATRRAGHLAARLTAITLVCGSVLVPAAINAPGAGAQAPTQPQQPAPKSCKFKGEYYAHGKERILGHGKSMVCDDGKWMEVAAA
jgi:hypothetical protein